jgi:hypothetical protein
MGRAQPRRRRSTTLARGAIAVTLALSTGTASVAYASSAYVIEQRSADSTSRLILAPAGLRFDFYAPVRSGGRLRAKKPKPLVGLIVRYGGGRLLLLDPLHRAYQALGLRSAVSSYESELKVLERAQPSAQLPPPPGSKPRTGQAPLTPPGARLKRLTLSARIGPVRAQAYLLREGGLRERIWYASALPIPPTPVRSLLAQALGGHASVPLTHALSAHAAQIPLRIDERSRRGWHTVLRTLSIQHRSLGARTLQPPRGYRKAKLLSSPATTKARAAETPAAPIRCGVVLISGALGCTSVGAELTGLAGPISEHPAIWAFYWGSGFASHLGYVSALNHGLENMVGDEFADPNSSVFYGPLGQYGVHRGRFLGYQVISDDNPDSSVGSWNFFDVEWFVLTHRWGSDAPHYWWRWSEEDPIFAIFVDESRVDSSGWSGYHFFAPTEGVFFSFLVHIAMPYFIIKVPALDSLPNDRDSAAWHAAVDVATERASHELVEAATDPYPFTSWADPLKQPIWEQGEIADICQEGTHNPWGKATRVVQYGSAFEPYWSNAAEACVPDAQPEAQMVFPANNESYSWKAAVPFLVRTNDLFDNGPVADSGTRWYDNGSEIGVGRGHSTFSMATLAPGIHHISVEVEDSQGGVRYAGPVTINIVVHRPSVRIEEPVNGETFGSDETRTYRGSAFDPQEGNLSASATWSVDGTPVGTGASLFRYRIPTEGTHTVTLSATNGAGASSSASVTVGVGPPTGKPSVQITSPPSDSNFAAGEPITFTATSEAQGGATVPESGYSWSDDVDGLLGTGSTITHTLSGSSCEIIIHHVTVTATDSFLRSASDTITVNVGSIC